MKTGQIKATQGPCQHSCGRLELTALSTLLLFHCRVNRQRWLYNGTDQLLCSQTEARVLSFDGSNQKHSCFVLFVASANFEKAATLPCHTIFTCMYVCMYVCTHCSNAYIHQLSLFVTKKTKTNFFFTTFKARQTRLVCFYLL